MCMCMCMYVYVYAMKGKYKFYVSSLLVSNAGVETLELVPMLKGSKACRLVYPALLTAVIGLGPLVIGCIDVAVSLL